MNGEEGREWRWLAARTNMRIVVVDVVTRNTRREQGDGGDIASQREA